MADASAQAKSKDSTSLENSKSENTKAEKATPDCCDEADGAMDCHKMPSCNGCNILGQVLIFVAPSFHITFDTVISSALSAPFPASLDPASVWRPPTNS